MGKLIVLDGLDGSGKSTQGLRLMEELQAKGKKIKLISFPDYAEPSSALVKMYLNGEFSDDPDAVNAFAASSFYAVDRYASYKKFWEADYLGDTVILATRYVSSNAIHQMEKLPKAEWDGYLAWLEDFEYEKLQLPRPDVTVFLDMSREVADRLIMSRYEGDESKKDIHEKNMDYLVRCRETARYAAEKQDWKVISCDDGKEPFAMEAITGKILEAIGDV